MKFLQKSALLIATAALVGGALVAGVAYAQTPAPTETPTEESQPPASQAGSRFGGWFDGSPFGRFFGQEGGQGMGRMGGRGLGHGPGMMGRGFGDMMGHGDMMGRGGMMDGPFAGEREAILAEALGMTSEELQSALDEGKSILAIAEAQGLDETELQAALQAATSERIDQAVADGDLSETQAARLKERLENGPGLLGMGVGMGRGPGMGGRGPLGGGALASIIGDPQELLTDATGMTSEELQTALQTTVEERVAAAVEAGKITQGEADAILERLDEGLPFFGPNHERPADETPEK